MVVSSVRLIQKFEIVYLRFISVWAGAARLLPALLRSARLSAVSTQGKSGSQPQLLSVDCRSKVSCRVAKNIFSEIPNLKSEPFSPVN